MFRRARAGADGLALCGCYWQCCSLHLAVGATGGGGGGGDGGDGAGGVDNGMRWGVLIHIMATEFQCAVDYGCASLECCACVWATAARERSVGIFTRNTQWRSELRVRPASCRTSFLAGLMECLKCTLIIADIAAATGALMEDRWTAHAGFQGPCLLGGHIRKQSEGRIGTCQELTGSPSDLQPLWWLLFCALILLLNTKLMSMSVQTLMAMTLSSLAIVVTYFLFS